MGGRGSYSSSGGRSGGGSSFLGVKINENMSMLDYAITELAVHLMPNMGDGASSDSIGYRIPNWILRKNLSQPELSAFDRSSVGIERETEKALYVSSMTDYGKIKTWVPKSALVTPAEYKAEVIKDIERTARFNLGADYNRYIKATAAENGVKAGNLFKTEKIQAKMDKNGVKYMSKETFFKQPLKDAYKKKETVAKLLSSLEKSVQEANKEAAKTKKKRP